jgi:ABC-2 type transport system permease protein
MTTSWHRFRAIVRKEFIQMRRDRLTFAMMVGIPIVQLIIFGAAINPDPKRLPTAVVSADHSQLTRTLVSAFQSSGYFALAAPYAADAEASRLLARGDVQFVLRIPANFTVDVMRGERPALLLEADASDPVTISNALGAVNEIVERALKRELKGAFAARGAGPPAVDLRIHRHYNPEGIAQYNIVPGLMGVILTMTMIVMTALAVTREVERGTMENLLSMPVRPLEVMVGKIVPYIMIGYIQVGVVLIAARWIFSVPVGGNIALLLLVVLVFVLANLTVGIVFSSIAQNQMQALQMGFFFFLPSLLLSGFMFPFRGMPDWAQVLGDILPLTHFLRIVRGVLLKSWGMEESLPEVWPMLLFTAFVLLIGHQRFRRTLD